MQIVNPIVYDSGMPLREPVFGLISFWNALPADVVYAPNVKIFQAMMQDAAWVH